MNRFKYHFLQEHLLLAHKMEGSLYMLSTDTILAFISLATVLNTSSVELVFPDGSGKESACNVGDLGLILGLGRSPGGGHATHSSILTWRISWTEESGGL